MSTIYFEKPIKAKIKINGEIVKNFPYKISSENIVFLEFLPVNMLYLPFCSQIYNENGKVVASNNLSLISFDENNILVKYKPNFVPIPLEFLDTINCEYKITLFSLVRYNLLIEKDKQLLKIINLVEEIYNPKISYQNGNILLTASSINKRYFMAINSNLEVKISTFCDSVKTTNKYLVVTNNFDDCLGRIRTVYYDIATLNTVNIEFRYKKSSSNLPLLFLDAYVAKDYLKIREYVSFDFDTATICNYLGDIEVLEQNNNTVYVLKENKIFAVNFSISNNKIDNLELI